MDDLKREQMDKMFATFSNESSSAGPQQYPAGYGSDMYNDRTDFIPVQEAALTQSGTDEAGNPIMSNPLNIIPDAEEAPKASTQGPISNAIDYLTKPSDASGPGMIETVANTLQNATSFANPVLSGTYQRLSDYAGASPEEREKLTPAAKVREYVHNYMPNATQIEHTQLWETFMLSPEQRAAELKRISDNTGLESSILAGNRNLYKKAAQISDRIDQMKKLAKYQDQDGEYDFDQMYKDIPGLLEVQRKQGTAAASIALNNIGGLQSVNDVYNNAASVFGGSVWTGLKRMGLSTVKSAYLFPSWWGSRAPTEEEQKTIKKIDEEIMSLPDYDYDSVSGTLGGIAGNVAENANLMAISMGSNLAARAVLGSALGVESEKAQKWTGTALSVAAMTALLTPSYFQEALAQTDKEGNPEYTPSIAARIALPKALMQSILEDWSFGKMGQAILAKSMAPTLASIYKAPTLEAMAAGAAQYIKLKAKEMFKAGIISGGAEFEEEFSQGFSDRVIDNLAQIFVKGEKADVKSIENILLESAGESLEAGPAILGFFGLGGIMNPIANTRAALRFRNQVRAIKADKNIKDKVKNAHLNTVIAGVRANKDQIRELHDKAPEAEATILDAQNRQAGFEYAFVDVRSMREQEGGEAVVQEIVRRNNVSEDDLAACMDGTGMLQVKTSTLMQMEATEAQMDMVHENITSNLTANTISQDKKLETLTREAAKDINTYLDDTYKTTIDNIIKARFPDEEQAKLAREIIEANFDNPNAEYTRRLNAVNAEIMQDIEPLIPLIREAIDNGVKLNEGETLNDVAINIASGIADTRFNIPGYENNTSETQARFQPIAERLQNLVNQRNALTAIGERMQALRPADMAATATLSAPALRVYDAMVKMMDASKNKKVQGSRWANAALAARYAENVAKRIAVARRNPNYSAEDYAREFLRVDANAEHNEEQMAAQLFMQEVTAEPSLQRTEDLQNIADTVSTVELNAVSARDPEAQAYMKEQMLKRGMKEEDADGLLAILDGITNDVVELARKYPAMLRWQTKELDRVVDEASKLLVPKLSAFKKNGEYKINIDLGTLCMKREAADVLNQILIGEGMGQQLGPSQLEALKDLLKSYKYLTACDVCFVEAKRVRMLADANKTSYDWKSTLLAAGITDSQVLGKERVFTKKQEERLKRMADPKTYREAFEEYMPQDRRRTKTNGDKGADLDTGTTPDKMLKIAKLFTEDPALAGELDPTTLITTAGTDYLARTYGGHTNIMPTLSGMYGSATSKPLEGFTLYDALSWRKSFDNAALDKNMEDVYAIGGGRAQSFTDFNPILFLDYVQMVADYEARNLPMHVYTKVPSFVQLFGETGIMINMSFVPEIVDGVDEAHAGLKWNEETQEWDYAWHEDSFPIDLAYELRRRKEYGGRVGIIAVGVSKEHIKKLMADPRIDMVIPYHASGMPHSVKLKTGLEIATDYTDVQTAKIPATAKEKIEKDHNIAAEEYLNYSRILREPEFKNPHDAAKEYLRRCDEYGCTPVFKEFRNEDGYFKVLEDFRGLDDNGNGVAQGPVRLRLPDNWKDILDEALGDRGKQKAMLEDLKTNEEILSKARAILKAQRLDGEIREVMLKRLRSALGQQKMTTEEKNALRAKYPKTWRKQRTSNVQSLKKSEFLDKLEAAYARDVSTEEAKARVEVFRMNNGIVYGFAQNGQIFLNENAFNANTPAHEFTHIWAKVAQEKNPKLWAEGVSLLKSDAREMWERVEKDPLYESIRGDENAIASEVLSRLVGEQNEEFVRELMDPTQKMPKGKGLTKRIQDWLLKVFNEVRSLFDPVDGKPLTFDEFRRMPLKTLWDVNANKQFRRNSVKYLQDLQEQGRVQADAIEMQGELLQQQGRTAKGSISVNERNERVIRLLESADQSTYMHEMAHLFLLDLEMLSGIDPSGQDAKDLQTIMEWAEYKEGQEEEYKGTASYEEFRKRAADIKKAEAEGNTEEAARLKRVWAQERFARGFEEYLRTGEAPAQGLRATFRKFKRWLQDIYKDVTGAGVRATPEVEAIMARMIASSEEIDAVAADTEYQERLRKLDPDYFPKAMEEMRRQWQEDAKERAKEKLLAQLMQQYEQQNLKDLDKKLAEMREIFEQEYQKQPVFICERMLAEGASMESALQISGFASENDYRNALTGAGGSMQAAIDHAMEQAKKNILEQMPSKEELFTMAEEALLSDKYQTELSAMEEQMIKAAEEAYDRLPPNVQRAFAELDRSFDILQKENWEDFKKQVSKLKYTERWAAEEYVMIQEFEDAANKLDPNDKEAVEKLRQKYERIKKAAARNKAWVRGIRDAVRGRTKYIRAEAERRMEEQPVSAATNMRSWHRQAIREGKRALDELAKAQSKGSTKRFEEAKKAKAAQAIMDAMTALAIENKRKLDKWMNGKFGFLNRAKRMADPKVKADPNLRYYYNHILYVFGIQNADAIPPTGLKSIDDVLEDLRRSMELEEPLPKWILTAAEEKEQGKNYQRLTMSELGELKRVTDMLYTLAVKQNQLITMDVSLDQVNAECAVAFAENIDYKAGRQRINEIKGAIGDYINRLVKPELMLSILGGKQGPFIKYIYRVLFTAAEAEEVAREEEAKAQRKLYGKYYTRQEMREMMHDPIMVKGPDGKMTNLSIGEDTVITRENLICMALNWGTELNRARLCVGLFDCETEEELALAEMTLMELMSTHLKEKDWQFVQDMWNHIGSYADPVSRTLEKGLGVPMKREKAKPFTVTLPDGKIIEMDGGYYPIVRDSTKSDKERTFEQVEQAKQLAGASVMGTGLGTTKDRAQNKFLNMGPLNLTLDVAYQHVMSQIHIITMKNAVRDAYKVLNSAGVKSMIQNTYGGGTLDMLNQWVLDNWAPPIIPREFEENIISKIRSRSVAAIMGYRVSTALLNTVNVVYMAQEIGVQNAFYAMYDFYKNPAEIADNREMIKNLSVFMRQRATNMDRDLQAVQQDILNRHEGRIGKIGNAIEKATGSKSEELLYQTEKFSAWLIEQTDMMVSMPLYMWQYKRTYNLELAKGVPEEEARETANFEATRRVTKVFPSSRKVDTSAVQRSRSELTKMLTPFFSFANTMFNAAYGKYFEQKYKGSNYGNELVPVYDAEGNVVTDEDGNIKYITERENESILFRRRYLRFIRAILLNYVIGSFFETWIRRWPEMLAGGGDDDEEDMLDVGPFRVSKKKWRRSALESSLSGFHGINELAMYTYDEFTGKHSYGGRGVGVISGAVERANKVVKDAAKLAEGSEKVDAQDLVRDLFKLSNTRTGFSDTMVDAFFNTARFISDDGYSLDNMDDLREYIAKSIFDRKLKKK